jgi:ribosomal protein S18 acetylase RimI-like enzyme
VSLLGKGEVLETRRLRIGIARPVEIEDLAGWLEKALQPEWTLADLRSQVEAGKCLVLRDEAGEPIGAVVGKRDHPAGGFASIPFIAVAPTRRFSGLGGEAAIAIERRLRAAGVERVFAPVPDGRGLAVYFWLRLGYRPLLREEAPWPLTSLSDVAPEGIWMVRDKD